MTFSFVMKTESHLSLSEGRPGGQEEEAEGQGSTECFVHFGGVVRGKEHTGLYRGDGVPTCGGQCAQG